jgi:RNA polymerase sigma factor for flagellar operon FliA
MRRETDPPEVLERFNDELALAELVARQVARSLGAAVPFADVLSAAREGLLDAARRYEPTRGTPFRSYASTRIRGCIIDHLRRSGPHSRRIYARLCAHEAAEALRQGQPILPSRADGFTEPAANPEQHLNDELASLATAAMLGFARAVTADGLADSEPNPEEALAHEELLDAVRRAVEQLPTDYASVIRYYYFEGCSLETVAQRLDISISWASRVHTRAIAMLNRCLKSRG